MTRTRTLAFHGCQFPPPPFFRATLSAEGATPSCGLNRVDDRSSTVGSAIEVFKCYDGKATVGQWKACPMLFSPSQSSPFFTQPNRPTPPLRRYLPNLPPYRWMASVSRRPRHDSVIPLSDCGGLFPLPAGCEPIFNPGEPMFPSRCCFLSPRSQDGSPFRHPSVGAFFGLPNSSCVSNT